MKVSLIYTWYVHYVETITYAGSHWTHHTSQLCVTDISSNSIGIKGSAYNEELHAEGLDKIYDFHIWFLNRVEDFIYLFIFH